MSVLRFDVPYTPPYRLSYQAASGDGARRAFWLGERPIVIDLAQEGDDGPVTATAYSNAPLEELAAPLRAAARHMIAADDDLGAFRETVAGDEALARLAEQLQGLKPLRRPDLWSALLEALIDQQISTAAGRAIRRRVAERFGPTLDVAGERMAVLPAARTLLEVPPEELRAAGLSGRKVEYARGLAEAVLGGTLDLERVQALPPEDAIKALVALRGVGVWTAEIAAIFALGARDAFPADDLGVRRSIGHLYHFPALPTSAEVRRVGERWAGWRSYAALYLWYAWPRLIVGEGAR
jgi:DNA-3-methyladenine glycosylase II